MVFGIQILAGHWQHSAYLGLLLFLYFAYEAFLGPFRAKLWPHWLYLLLVVGSVGTLLAMVQVIPTRELGYLSVRSDVSYWDVSSGNEPLYLWTLFLPNFFGGLNGVPQWYPYDLAFNYVFLTVPGCLLALLGLLETIRKRNFFWLGMVILFTELSFGEKGQLAGVIYHLPILNLFRSMSTYFDLANLGLCLMAALGAEALFSKVLSPRYKQYLSSGLIMLFALAIAVGLVLHLGQRIHDWYHMLAALGAFSIVVSFLLKNKLSPSVSQWLVFGLLVFELCYYNMDQQFNSARNDPQKYLSYELAAGRGETLHFLRSDVGGDFRVAGLGPVDYTGNGWNVWRIPGIYGWNPIVLRRYEDYIRGFTQTSNYLLPYGGKDHRLDSPMLDLLGVKYLVVKDDLLERKLAESPKFKLVFEEQDWWKVYRNNDYLSRAWFYPTAYRVADEKQAVALMTSRWFQARHTLLFEGENREGEAGKHMEDLSVIVLQPKDAAAASHGSAVMDPNCSEPRPMFTDWGRRGDWIRYDVPGAAQPGRYLLLMQYTATQYPSPSLRIAVETGDRQQPGETVPLAGTSWFVFQGQDYWWFCRKWRAAELGEIEIGPGLNRITISSNLDSNLNIYTLWLVRLPPSPSPDSGNFSFSGFSVNANRVSFDTHLTQDGFVLLNEIDYPGWEATINGKGTPILRADTIFRALYLPAGSHHIEMRFRPRNFMGGAGTSLLTLVVFLIYAALEWRNKRLFSTKDGG